MKTICYLIAILLLANACSTAQPNSKEQILHGWLSDEQCARGRASSGVYTGTNPTCAKECVTAGKKIVFIDPDAKRVLLISNQAVAKNNVGDQVEIVGVLDSQAKSIQVTSVKLLEHGVAMCARPQKGEQ